MAYILFFLYLFIIIKFPDTGMTTSLHTKQLAYCNNQYHDLTTTSLIDGHIICDIRMVFTFVLIHILEACLPVYRDG